MMKKLLLFLVFCGVAISGWAQTKEQKEKHKLRSKDFCIESITLKKNKKGENYLEVLVVNNGHFFSYPTIEIKVDGKIVATQDNHFRTYGQGKGSDAYQVTTKLVQAPKKCQVTIYDNLWKTSCVVPYPCSK